MSRFLRHVEEACDTLGYVHQQAAPWIADIIDKFDYDATRFVRTHGTPLEAEARKSLKLGNLRMTKEAWAALTELGRQQPAQGLELTVRRALCAAHRERDIADLMKTSYVEQVQIICFNPCNAIETFTAAMPHMPKSLLPQLPLKGCSKAICECKVHRHYDYEQWTSTPNDAADADRDGTDAVVVGATTIIERAETTDRGEELKPIAPITALPPEPMTAWRRIGRWIWHALAIFGAICVLALLFAR